MKGSNVLPILELSGRRGGVGWLGCERLDFFSLTVSLCHIKSCCENIFYLGIIVEVTFVAQLQNYFSHRKGFSLSILEYIYVAGLSLHPSVCVPERVSVCVWLFYIRNYAGVHELVNND